MSNTLYRKYRPQKFSEVIGQNHIVQTLSNAIKNNRVGQAYLFTGPRGTGKTTLARLFAKAVNCENIKDAEPCLKCEICKNIAENRSLDIIEIDAASNTGVDNIRELRETIKLPPTQAKYKVYIIDEVHMLSSGAFNALLKTLEEPPTHVIFILATTEIHKVPETIISRCQRFDFMRLSFENIIKKLSQIAKKEDIKIEKNALEMIAVSAEGGMRDAESLLAQVIALEDKNITAKEVENILGTSDHGNTEKMAELLLEKNISGALKLVNNLTNEGHDLEVFNKSLLNYLRQLLVVSVDKSLSKTFSLELTSEQIEKIEKISKDKTGDILKLLGNFSEIQGKIKSSFIPQLPLEMAIVKVGNFRDFEIITQPNNTESPVLRPEPIIERNIDSEIAMKEIEEESIPEYSNAEINMDQIFDNWRGLIQEIKPYNHSLSAFLINCQPVEIKDGQLIIATKYEFYKDKLSETQNKLTIENVLAKILGTKLKVKFLSEDEAGIKIKSQSAPKDSSSPQKPRETSSLLDDALEMMGGKIVEE
jgi:DNA polymerase-3 subunit gamma/tau